jgi:hypothetical protein
MSMPSVALYVAQIYLTPTRNVASKSFQDKIAIQRVLIDKLRQIVIARRPLAVYFIHETDSTDESVHALAHRMANDGFLPTTKNYISTIIADKVKQNDVRVFCHCTRNLAQDGYYKVVPDPAPTYTSEYYRLILAALKKNQSLT